MLQYVQSSESRPTQPRSLGSLHGFKLVLSKWRYPVPPGG